MDNLKSKSFKAVIWDFFGKIARHITSLVVLIVLARLLDPSDFGLLAMAMVIVQISYVFSDIGLGGALIQRRRVLPVHYASVFYLNIFIGAIFTLITFFSASWISDFYNNQQLTPILKTISFLFLIYAFGSVQTNKLRRELRYDAIVKSNIIAALVSGAIGISFALYGAGVWSLVAQVISGSLFYIISIWITAKWVPPFLFSFKALMQLWGYGFRIFIVELLDTIFNRLDILIIGKLFSITTIGFFDQAKRLNQLVIKYSSDSISSVLFPALSKVQNDLQRFQTIMIKTLEIISFIIFFLLGLLYLISEDLIVLIFTDKWLMTAEYFKLLLLSGFGYPISGMLVKALSSRGNSKELLRVAIYNKILLASNLYIGFLWGIDGYLYGLIIVSFFSVLLHAVFTSREINLSVVTLIKPVAIQMLLSIVTVLSVNLISAWIDIGNLVLCVIEGILFIIVYIVINMILNTDSYSTIKNQISPVLSKRFLKG